MKKLLAYFFALICLSGMTGCFTDAGTKPAKDLHMEETPSMLLEGPPALTVLCGDASIDAMLGAFSWTLQNADGTYVISQTDAAHPLSCEFQEFETTEPTAVLRFQENPAAILKIQCWSEDQWGDPSASGEALIPDGYELELKPGGFLYDVEAEWDTGNGCTGAAHYSFYVKLSQ